MKTQKVTLGLLLVVLVPSMAWSMEVAKVNGKAITDKDLTGALSGLNESQRENVLKDANSRKKVLNSVIDEELLTQEGEKEKIDQDAEYRDALANFHKQFIANRLLQKNLSSKLTDSAAKKFYEKNKFRYSTEQVHAQHILVADEAKAVEILKLAKAPGADFQALAEKYSKDTSAKNNRGDLGFFGRDRMVPEFTGAAFAAKDGEIVGPVRTSYGYHIIKVIEKKPGNVLEYSDVEARVKADLQQELTMNYLTKLREQAKVSIDDKALSKVN